MSSLERRLQKRMEELVTREMERKAQAQIINNIYGGAGPAKDPSERDLEHLLAPDAFDYNVDITRENTPGGWVKRVKRYRSPKE